MPPNTADIASKAVRTILFSGCWAVSEHPAVWVWNLSFNELSFFAPYLSFSRFAQILRAALYLAISSKKSIWALKKKDNLWAKSSIFNPLSKHSSIYANPLLSVKASSCAAVDPASLIWYPLTDTGLYNGMFSEQYSIISTTSLTDGSGGKIHSFWAMYSFNASFCKVPLNLLTSIPFFLASAT